MDGAGGLVPGLSLVEETASWRVLFGARELFHHRTGAVSHVLEVPILSALDESGSLGYSAWTVRGVAGGNAAAIRRCRLVAGSCPSLVSRGSGPAAGQGGLLV